MLQAAASHLTDFFTPNTVLSAKPVSAFRLPHVYSRVNSVHPPRLPSCEA